MTARGIMSILVATVAVAAGCGRPSSNLSPTPEMDPRRFARAQRQSENVERENREAEANFYRRMSPDGVSPEGPTQLPAPTDTLVVADH